MSCEAARAEKKGGLSMTYAQAIQALAIVAPLLVTGLIAWDRLVRQMSAVDARVMAQNGRVGKLEEGVMYRDTCAALHGQTAEMLGRVETDIRDLRADLTTRYSQT